MEVKLSKLGLLVAPALAVLPLLASAVDQPAPGSTDVTKLVNEQAPARAIRGKLVGNDVLVVPTAIAKGKIVFRSSQGSTLNAAVIPSKYYDLVESIIEAKGTSSEYNLYKIHLPNGDMIGYAVGNKFGGTSEGALRITASSPQAAAKVKELIQHQYPELSITEDTLNNDKNRGVKNALVKPATSSNTPLDITINNGFANCF